MVAPLSNSKVSPAHTGVDTSAMAAARLVTGNALEPMTVELLLFLLITLILLKGNSMAAWNVQHCCRALRSKHLGRSNSARSPYSTPVAIPPPVLFPHQRPFGHQVVGMGQRFAKRHQFVE